jgi:hypothetical protein
MVRMIRIIEFRIFISISNKMCLDLSFIDGTFIIQDILKDDLRRTK